VAEIEADLLQFGAILFRGFEIDNVQKLQAFSRIFVPELLEYKERRSPRTDLGDKVYSSTVHPADQVIHFHNTTSFSHQWPRKIWFCCIVPASWRGFTPLAHCGRVLEHMRSDVRDRFLEHGVLYTRNFHPGIGLSWQNTFNTRERGDVDRYCSENGIQYEWIGERLRTAQIRHAAVRHPVTGGLTWFNQAYHFHVTSLPEEVSRTLLDSFPEDQLPRNAYFGNRDPLTPEVLQEIDRCYEAERVEFAWQKGDVVMIDNMLVAHARTTYRGDRLIALTLGDPYTSIQNGQGIVCPISNRTECDGSPFNSA
jgi:alpha-ketoglutarate-dependent taurine dioxygenase